MNESELNPSSPEFEDFSIDDNADEENLLTEHELPLAVLESFNEAFPHAADVAFEEESNEEGETVYAVEFTNQGVETEASYSADGTLLKLEEEIQPSELPEAVTEAIMQAYPDAIILEAEKIVAADGSISGYEVEIEDDDVELEIHLDPNGLILNTELETETGETV
jgi:uncharacterized membrane protein YkoI